MQPWSHQDRRTCAKAVWEPLLWNTVQAIAYATATAF